MALVWATSSGPVNAPRAKVKATGTSTSSGIAARNLSPTPSDSTTSTVADPFGVAAQSYIANREGTASAAVYDLDTGQTWTFGGEDPQDEASVVKVAILETLLARSNGQGLPATDQSLAQSMIELSDNDAATDLWDQAGGASGIGSFDTSAGLRETTPSLCVQCPGFPWPGWGLTTTTATDQIALLRLLVEPNPLLSSNERHYALDLMEQVTPSEDWGVSGGVPSGVTVALKNGWLPLDAADTDWQINSVGWVSGAGHNYLLAVLTTGNPSEQYGIDTIQGLSSMVWNALS